MSAGENLLVELLVEELPPKALKKLGDAFAKSVYEGLNSRKLLSPHSVATAFASPRRLAVHITAVADVAPDEEITEKLMPVAIAIKDDKPTDALRKRLAKVGRESLADLWPNAQDGSDKLFIKTDDKTEAVYLSSLAKGSSLLEGLQSAVEEAIESLPIPKVMSYQLVDGWHTVNFVRPAHGLLVLHGADIVAIHLLGMAASDLTHGHRFEARTPTVEIRNADSYEKQLLEEGAVIASFEKRRDEIARQLEAAANKEGLTPIKDDALLDEVTALVECPNVLLGQFEKTYLEVPPECLILTMKANQKYFPLLDAKGKLTNKFLIVSNISPKDASAVIGGNERVVRPRLADAKFFFDQDRKKTLESRVVGLDKVVYHNKLGSQGERTKRVSAIAKAIGQELGGKTLAAQAEQAAMLAKADLLTDMVGEFPELQGVMGSYYAKQGGLSDEIAEAIEDHYKPRFAGDSLPRNKVGGCVALADKLETLVGLFGVNQIPTGDKDPFGLRRHGLGVIRILAEQQLSLSLEFLLKTAIKSFPPKLLQLEFKEGDFIVKPLWIKIDEFLVDRAVGYIKDQGYSAQEADAVIYISSGPVEYISRLKAIRKAQLMFPEEFASLANADKRARNILSKSGGQSEVLLTDENLCLEAAEKNLLRKTRELRGQIDGLVKAGDFEEALLLTVHISNPVTAFFDNVMVNAEEDKLRLNRFRLLHEVTGLTNRVADISKLAT